jgi:hypothetical protein
MLKGKSSHDAEEGNLLMLIKLDSDAMAFASLLVSIVGAVAAIFAAFYANIAACCFLREHCCFLR